MTLSGSGPAARWRAFVAVGLAAGVWAASGVWAQQAQTPPPTQTPPPAQTPPAGQPPAAEKADPLKLKGDVPVLLINQILSEKAADFEAAWAAIREKLAQSEKPELKAFGQTLTKMYKVDIPADAAQGVSIYVFQIDQPSATQSYHPVEVLYKSGAFTPEEAKQIFDKLGPGYKGIQPWPLVKVGS